MEENEMNQIAAFLQKRLAIEKPDPDEFATSEIIRSLDAPKTTVENYLLRAQQQKLVSSRKLGRIRYWRIIDEKAWQEWLEGKKGVQPADLQPD